MRRACPSPAPPSPPPARRARRPGTTDADGRFNIPFLTPGTYDIRAELQGFKAVERKGVTISLGQTLDVPLKMEVGGLSETVNVTVRRR